MPDDITTFSRELRRLLARPQLRQEFMELETTDDVCEKFKISDKLAVELKKVLTSVSSVNDVEEPEISADELDDKALETVSTAEDFLERSFGQLRTGAWVLIVMSITMFLIGVSFLVIAAIRSFTHPESAEVTGIIAGIGVVQIVFLFYKNPLRDISQSISNSQQAKLVVMSYMLGVSLIAKSLKGTATEKQQQELASLTQQALERLEQFAEAKTTQTDADQLLKSARPAADAN